MSLYICIIQLVKIVELNSNLSFVLIVYGSYLLWSLHMRTTYLCGFLNTVKKTEVYSLRSFEAKTKSPNGPTDPPSVVDDVPFWLQSNCGSFHSGFNISAFFKFSTLNEISTSACNYIYISTKKQNQRSLNQTTPWLCHF